jgi:hypothetical protein
VTLPSFRRRPRPVLDGDFPSDEAVTEVLGRVPDWDGTTITFGGTSGAGGSADWDAGTITGAFGGTSAIGLGPDAQPFARPPGPETLPLVPPPPPEPVRRPADDAIFVIIWSARGFGLLCGIDLWRRHADPEAAHYRNQFDALRISALRAGWRPDTYGRWCCPRCVADSAWAAPALPDHYHPGVVHARTAADPAVSREYWEARPAIEYHRDAADAFASGDPVAEFWFRIEAEAEVLARTAEGAWHGRHEGGAR